MSRADEAVECFHQGFNCAQSVLTAFCESLGLDKQTALKISCGLGGGMGRLGETCGAVTGAYLLIGLMHGKCVEDDDEAKEQTYGLVQEFSKRFKQRNHSTICRNLMEVDLLSGDRQTIDAKVKTVCPKMIRDAAEIIEEILFIQ